jgi:hypothetical protein
MNTTDWIGTLAFAAFGAWWIVLPRSVIRFYGWFHRGRLRAPSTVGIQIVGAFWILLVCGVAWRVVAK